MEESCQIFISITQGQMQEKNNKDSQYIIQEIQKTKEKC